MTRITRLHSLTFTRTPNLRTRLPSSRRIARHQLEWRPSCVAHIVVCQAITDAIVEANRPAEVCAACRELDRVSEFLRLEGPGPRRAWFDFGNRAGEALRVGLDEDGGGAFVGRGEGGGEGRGDEGGGGVELHVVGMVGFGLSECGCV